ncbi:MAG: UbiA family prenyltransferase [Gemmatimonadota bacterium]
MIVPAWAEASRARRAGYRVFGSGFAYLLHLRPTEWPIMLAHTALGYLLAVGITDTFGVHLGQGVVGILLWVACLNGGTLAINSAFDRDEGDIGYLRRPPPVPSHLFAFGLGLMVLGQVLAFFLPLEFVWAYAACFLLSVLYSVPPFRFKAVAGADWIINMWGFGTLTPYAGWAATGTPLNTSGLIALLAFCPLFAALYPLTQLYQFDEDQRRGDRTLALKLGKRASLDIALAATAIAFGLLAFAGLKAGWSSARGDLLRWTGWAIAFLAWLVILIPWRVHSQSMTPDQHQRGMYQALAAWAVTDIVVVLALG